MKADEQAHDAVVAAVRNLLLIRLTRSLEPSPSLGTGSLSLPGSAYIQWTQVDHETRVLHVEINEGTFTDPMPQAFGGTGAARLARAGPAVPQRMDEICRRARPERSR